MLPLQGPGALFWDPRQGHYFWGELCGSLEAGEKKKKGNLDVLGLSDAEGMLSSLFQIPKFPKIPKD